MLKHSFILFLSLFILTSSIYSDDTSDGDPLFSGTLLAIYSKNAAPLRLTMQPFFYMTRVNGTYDNQWNFHNNFNNHQYLFSVLLETGLTDFLDIGITPNFIYSKSTRFETFLSGDTSLFLGMQLVEDQKNSWIPDIRLLLQETFPTGDYQNLDIRYNGIDASGSGAYQTSFILVTRKVFARKTMHPFNINLNLGYFFSADVDISGLSTYGGDETTSGKVQPGDEFIANLAFEMAVTKHFGYGIDLNYQHSNRAFFFPKNTGTEADLPSSELISLAPCLEYNFNENMGLIWGVWFPIVGRNVSSFLSGVTSFFYYF